MKPKVFPVLDMAIENGIHYGLNRAYKHSEDPTREQLVDSITDAVMNSICEWFDLEDMERD